MPRYTLPREHKGEWAEIEFLSKAHARGFIVSRPWGQNAPYDFIVQRHRLLHRIQVKSVWSKHNGQYIIRMSRSDCSLYRPHDFEFLAAYVVPENAWYIIPIAAISKRPSVAFYPHVKRSRGLLEKYRERWHLLK